MIQVVEQPYFLPRNEVEPIRIFSESIPVTVPNQASPYRNYFDDFGNYVMLTDEYIENVMNKIP